MSKLINYLLLFLVAFYICCKGTVLSDEDVLRVGDTLAPCIRLEHPLSGTHYTSTVNVSGRVSDLASRDGTPGAVAELTCDVSGLFTQRGVYFERDGRFSFSFTTTGSSGSLLLSLRAKDWNRNASDVAVTLLPGAIPSFSLIPENHQVTLSWEPVHSATGYTLYCLADGTDVGPAEHSLCLQDVTSPCVVDRLSDGQPLQNGHIYSFLLVAHSSSGTDDFSAVLEAIPLSPFTLAPRVTAGYGYLQVDWEDIPGEDHYIIRRSPERDGDYSLIGLSQNGTGFTDHSAAPGDTCYYKIAPASQPDFSSLPACGTSSVMSPFLAPVGEVCSATSLVSLAVGEGIALAGDLESTLRVFSLADPARPSLLASWSAGGNILDIALSGKTACLALDSAGVAIVDISDPEVPRLLSRLETEGNASGVKIRDALLYLAARGGGLYLYDLEDPGEPRFLSCWSSGEQEIYDIALEGNYAFLACGNAGLQVMDITDSYNPEPVIACSRFTGNLRALAVADGICYMASGPAGLRFFDVSNPEDPYYIGPLEDLTSGNIRDVALQGDFTILAGDALGVEVLATRDPGNMPAYAGCYSDGGAVSALAVYGRYTYAATADAGLVVLDTAYPHVTPAAVVYRDGSPVSDVRVRDGYAVLANREKGVSVVDITDHGYPVLSGSLVTASPVTDLLLAGNYAFLTGIDLGLLILDIADPAHPQGIGEFSFKGNSAGCCLRGDWIYVSCWSNTEEYSSGLYIIDISDPRLPRLTGKCLRKTGSARSVLVRGDNAWLADKEGGLVLIDISDRTDPQFFSAELRGLAPVDLEKSGSLLLLAGGAQGLVLCDVIDFRNPEMICSLGSDITGAFTQGICGVDDYIFCAEGVGGMRTVGISSDRALFDISCYKTLTGNEAEKVRVHGTTAYLAGGDDGLLILSLWPYD